MYPKGSIGLRKLAIEKTIEIRLFEFIVTAIYLRRITEGGGGHSCRGYRAGCQQACCRKEQLLVPTGTKQINSSDLAH